MTGGTLVVMGCSVSDCIDTIILAVTPYESSAKCYHWGKLGRGKLYYLAQLHVNLQSSQDKKFNYENINTRVCCCPA